MASQKAWVFLTFSCSVFEHFFWDICMVYRFLTRLVKMFMTAVQHALLVMTTMKPLAPTWQMVPVHFIRQTDQTEKYCSNGRKQINKSWLASSTGQYIMFLPPIPRGKHPCLLSHTQHTLHSTPSHSPLHPSFISLTHSAYTPLHSLSLAPSPQLYSSSLSLSPSSQLYISSLSRSP